MSDTKEKLPSKWHIWQEFERFRRDQFELSDAHYLTLKECGPSGWRVSIDFEHHDGPMPDLFVSTGMSLEACIWECLCTAPGLVTFALNGTGWAPNSEEPRRVKNQWRKAIATPSVYAALEEAGLIEWIGGDNTTEEEK